MVSLENGIAISRAWFKVYAPTLIGGLVGLAVFSLFLGEVIRPRNWLADDLLSFFAPTLIGSLVGGAGLGAVAAWVGGVGIAAMGTAVGVSMFPLIAIGALVGVGVGGFFGSAMTLLDVFRNPASYVIEYEWLIVLAVLSVVSGLLSRIATLRLLRWLNSRRAPKSLG